MEPEGATLPMALNGRYTEIAIKRILKKFAKRIFSRF